MSSNTVINLVAGPFAPVVAAVWPKEKLTQFLAASDHRRQVWYACLSAEAHNFSPTRTDPSFIFDRLTSWRSKDLIAQAFGCRPPGFVRLLTRLGSRAREPKFYCLALEAMERGGAGAKLLMHTPDPSDQLVETIAALPKDMSWDALNSLAGFPANEAPETLAMYAWTADRLKIVDPQFSNAGKRTSEPLSWLLDYLAMLPFPAAPWPGTNILRPIPNGTELYRLGREFRNCLTYDAFGPKEMLSILNGGKCIYEWCGEERGLIQLFRVGSVGWFADDVRGVNNVAVSSETRVQIANSFAKNPTICATRLLVRSNIYPCSRFWRDIVHQT